MSNIYGTHDINTIEQFQAIQRQSKRSALMADGHLGYVMPIGGVAGYINSISIVGVGLIEDFNQRYKRDGEALYE